MPALIKLAQDARLAPENARYVYVYTVALHSAGRSKLALAVLKAADNRHSLHLEAGDKKAALAYAQKAAEAFPQNPQLRTQIEQLMTVK